MLYVPRLVECRVEASTWTRAPPPSALLSLSGERFIDVGGALLETALRTRPPTTVGIHLADTWAWMRYLPALGPGERLCLRSEWDEIDAHQKTILSDDWGMGFTTSVVAEALQVVAWADTARFVALVEPSVWLARTGKHGPPKAPDFVGLTSSWEFVVLEAKGTQVSRDALTKQLGKGVSQKKNVRFKDPKLLSECLVAGLFVPQAHSKSTALLEIHDPEPPAHSTEITGPAARLASAVVQCEVGTLLPLVGLPRLGADVVSAPLDGSPRLTPGPEVEDLEALTIDDRGYRGMRREYPLPPRAMEHCGIVARRVEVVAAVRDATLNRLFGGSVHEACSTMSLELRNAAVKPVSVPLDLDPRSFLASHERGSFADHRPVWQRETPTGFLLRVEFHVD